jgi:hypothetical protein
MAAWRARDQAGDGPNMSVNGGRREAFFAAYRKFASANILTVRDLILRQFQWGACRGCRCANKFINSRSDSCDGCFTPQKQPFAVH